MKKEVQKIKEEKRMTQEDVYNSFLNGLFVSSIIILLLQFTVILIW